MSFAGVFPVIEVTTDGEIGSGFLSGSCGAMRVITSTLKSLVAACDCESP